MVNQAGSPGPQDEIQSKCFILKKFLELWWVNFEKKFNFKFFCYPLGTHFGSELFASHNKNKNCKDKCYWHNQMLSETVCYDPIKTLSHKGVVIQEKRLKGWILTKFVTLEA